MLSDESCCTLLTSNGRTWMWWASEECFKADFIMIMKGRGGSMMVWGCFTWYGLDPLVILQGNMNAWSYSRILDIAVLPALTRVLCCGPLPVPAWHSTLPYCRVLTAVFCQSYCQSPAMVYRMSQFSPYWVSLWQLQPSIRSQQSWTIYIAKLVHALKSPVLTGTCFEGVVLYITSSQMHPLQTYIQRVLY